MSLVQPLSSPATKRAGPVFWVGLLVAWGGPIGSCASVFIEMRASEPTIKPDAITGAWAIGAAGFLVGLGLMWWRKGLVLAFVAGLVPGGLQLLWTAMGLLTEWDWDWTSGRPLRDASGRARRSRLFRDGPPSASHVDDAVLEEWRNVASAEHASIAAFEQLAAELSALGAPRDLVGRAAAAAREEQRHAADALAIVEDLSGERWRFRSESRPPRREATLSQLAAESLVDGCLGEGLAAALAAQLVPLARLPNVRVFLFRVARDEAGHAELAWDIVAWCVEQDASVLGTLHAARQALRAQPRNQAVDGENLGIPSVERVARTSLRCLEALDARCLAELDGRATDDPGQVAVPPG
jgi:hypothetical protein